MHRTARTSLVLILLAPFIIPSLSAAPATTRATPAVEFSRRFGSPDGDDIQAVAVDREGNAYFAGFTISADYPLVNPLPVPAPAPSGSRTAGVLTKLSPDGSTILYSTYLGGSNGWDAALDVAVDSAGNIYVVGGARSSDLPVTMGTQPFGGAEDAFLVVLDPEGDILFSTYFGGEGDDLAWKVAVVDDGTVWIAGTTDSPDLPLRDALFPEQRRLFLARFDPSTSDLLYATYFGSESGSFAYPSGLAIGPSRDLYLSGSAEYGFPTTPGAFQTEIRGRSDAFVARFAADGSRLVYSTLLGGSSGEFPSTVSVGRDSTVYVVGSTISQDFPTTPDAVQPTDPDPGRPGGPPDIPEKGWDAFLVKLDPDGRAISYGTYLGGTFTQDTEHNGQDFGVEVSLDEAENVYVGGIVYESEQFPVKKAFQPAPNRQTDGFVAKFVAGSMRLEWCSFLGGDSGDTLTDLAVTPEGDVFTVIHTLSQNFPYVPADQTVGSIVATKIGSTDVLIDRIEVASQSDKPLRLRIVGERFKTTAQVFIGEDAAPWPGVVFKSAEVLILRGPGLEARFPTGVATRVRVVNPKGGSATYEFTRQ